MLSDQRSAISDQPAGGEQRPVPTCIDIEHRCIVGAEGGLQCAWLFFRRRAPATPNASNTGGAVPRVMPRRILRVTGETIAEVQRKIDRLLRFPDVRLLPDEEESSAESAEDAEQIADR